MAWEALYSYWQTCAREVERTLAYTRIMLHERINNASSHKGDFWADVASPHV